MVMMHPTHAPSGPSFSVSLTIDPTAAGTHMKQQKRPMIKNSHLTPAVAAKHRLDPLELGAESVGLLTLQTLHDNRQFSSIHALLLSHCPALAHAGHWSASLSSHGTGGGGGAGGGGAEGGAEGGAGAVVSEGDAAGSCACEVAAKDSTSNILNAPILERDQCGWGCATSRRGPGRTRRRLSGDRGRVS